MTLFYSTTFITVLLGAVLYGGVSGLIGTFALLRRQSLVGDALAHAALPGVCISFLITQSKSPESVLTGAFISGLLGSLFILLVVRGSRIKEDAAIGIVLSVFFAVGIVLLTYIQKRPFGDQSGLDSFLFGQAATLLHRDVVVFTVLGSVVMVVILLFFKEFKVISFDRDYAATLGVPVRRIEILLTLLLVTVVVIGLQTVGVVLMIAALITPAAAARQWSNRLSVMVVAAALIGAVSSAVGVVASMMVDRLPTGPVVVLTSSFALILSVLFAPNRGLIWEIIGSKRFANRISRENLLKDLYLCGERTTDWSAYLSFPHLMGMRGGRVWQLRRAVGYLRSRGSIESEHDSFRLTEVGLRQAATVVRKHRLWELYLAKRLELPTDHVHRDAEAMEHVLSDQAMREFATLLGHPTVDPHGRPIPPDEGSRE